MKKLIKNNIRTSNKNTPSIDTMLRVFRAVNRFNFPNRNPSAKDLWINPIRGKRPIATRVNSSKLLTAISDLKSMGIQLNSFPNVVVVGPQSSGKSSVIEAICGKEILPKAMTMSTMKPTQITLIRSNDSLIKVGSRIYKTEQDAAEEIKRLNSNDYIQKIIVEIHASDVYDCSLIDLPGLFVVASDEDAGLPKKIKEITLAHLKDEHNINLVVHAAPSDPATNQAISLVKKFGKGNQSLIVATKVDQLGKQKSTHISSMLAGKTYNLGFGTVAVVLRSDTEIEDGKTIAKKMEEEALFFRKNGLAPSGVAEMRQMISEIQTLKIKDQLPELLKDVEAAIEATKSSKTFMDDLIGNDQSKLATQLRIMIEKLVGSSTERAIFENRLKIEFRKAIKSHLATSLNMKTIPKNDFQLSEEYVDYNILHANRYRKTNPKHYGTDGIKELFSNGLISTVFMDNKTLNTAFKNEADLAIAMPLIDLYLNDPLGNNRLESNRMLNRCFTNLLKDDTIHKMVRDITEQQLMIYIEEDGHECAELTKKFAEYMIKTIGEEAYESKIKYSITAMLNLEKRPQVSSFEILRYITQQYPEYFKFDNKIGLAKSLIETKEKLKINVYGPEWNNAYIQVVSDKLIENCYRNVAVNLLDQMVTRLLEVCFDMFNKGNVEKQKRQIENKVMKLEEIRGIIKTYDRTSCDLSS